jgi:hypothetical protein
MPSFEMISTELRRKGLKIRELPGEYRVERGGAVTVSATLEEAAEYGRSLPAATHRPPAQDPMAFSQSPHPRRRSRAQPKGQMQAACASPPGSHHARKSAAFTEHRQYHGLRDILTAR